MVFLISVSTDIYLLHPHIMLKFFDTLQVDKKQPFCYNLVIVNKGAAMPTISEINHEIMQGNFTNDQLNAIIAAVKFRRAQISREVKHTIRVGDTVKFYHPKLGRDLSGPVKKVKIKNVLVSTPAGTYNVPANLLETV